MTAPSQSASLPLGTDLALLRQNLRAAFAAKRAALHELKSLCRSESAALRARLRDLRAGAMRDLREEEKQARARAKASRDQLLAQARRSSPVEGARSALAIERKHAAEQQRITRTMAKRRTAIDKSHAREVKSSAPIQIGASTLAKIEPLLEEAGIERAPGESTAETLRRLARSRPQDVLALLRKVRVRIAPGAAPAMDQGPGTAAPPPPAPSQSEAAATVAPRAPATAPMAPKAPQAPPPNAYQQKKAARIERLRARADRFEAEAKARHASATARADIIPLGQPILVGHHSEKRDRRFRERIRTDFTKAYETQGKADELRRRASSAETSTAVSSDDPEAVAQLRVKVQRIERDLARAREINAAIRTAKRHATRDGKPWQPIAVAALGDMGIPPSAAEQLVQPDFAGRIGVADYKFTNLGAERRRLEKRISELEKRTSSPTRSKETIGDAAIWEEDNRVKITFPGKPPEKIRGALKSAGFHWSPTIGAWMRMASNQAWYQARRIANECAAPSPAVAEVLAAVDAARETSGLSFVPTVVARLAPTVGPEAAKAALLDAAKSGLVELRPEGGLNRLTEEQKRDCPPGPQGSCLSWVRRLGTSS
jgi:hypothetical protein